MTPEISLLEAELEEARELVKSRRHRLQMAKDAYWTDHFKAQGIVEGETVVIAKDYYYRELTCVIRWTNRQYPIIIHGNRGMPTRLKEIVKCFSNS